MLRSSSFSQSPYRRIRKAAPKRLAAVSASRRVSVQQGDEPPRGDIKVVCRQQADEGEEEEDGAENLVGSGSIAQAMPTEGESHQRPARRDPHEADLHYTNLQRHRESQEDQADGDPKKPLRRVVRPPADDTDRARGAGDGDAEGQGPAPQVVIEAE